MTRIDILALFTALKKLCEKGDIESVQEVIDEVLREVKKEDKTGK